MILYYLILGAAFCMSVAAWYWYRENRALRELWAVRVNDLETENEVLQVRLQGARSAALDHERRWRRLRKGLRAQTIRADRAERSLRQHQAAAGYRRSGESVDLRTPPTPVACESSKTVEACCHPVDAVKWNPGNEAYQCHCCGTQLFLHEDGGRYSFSEKKPASLFEILRELFKSPGVQTVANNWAGAVFGRANPKDRPDEPGDPVVMERDPWA